MKKYLLKVIVGIVLPTFFSGCYTEKPERPKDVVVDILVIEPAINLSSNSYTGVVEESYTSMLSFRVPGNIRQIFADENKYVEKGQLLASLDKTILQNNYSVALAAFTQAEDAFKRFQILYDQNSLPEIKWIEAGTMLQSARAALNIAENNLENSDLYAPFSGVITRRITDVGANIMPGVPVFSLVNIENVKVKIPIPENEVSSIQIGQRAQIKVMALGADNSYIAEISERSPVANPLSHTYDAKIELENKNKRLMPGMLCDVNILLKNNEEPDIIIPNHSIMIDSDNKKFVWLVKDNITSKQIVECNAFSESGVVISHGLVKGDMVVVNGNHKISDGMKIQTR